MRLTSLQQQPRSPSSRDSRLTPTTSILTSSHEDEGALPTPTAIIPTSAHEDHGAPFVAVYTQPLHLEAMMGAADATYAEFLERRESPCISILLRTMKVEAA